MKTVTAYACSFHPTSKLFTAERSAVRHESECIHNPATKSCPTCQHDLYHFCSIGVADELRKGCPDHQAHAEVAA